ncbi:MAG: hypothetical protein ACYS30_25765, partial [Planctomycetota bacterium]
LTPVGPFQDKRMFPPLHSKPCACSSCEAYYGDKPKPKPPRFYWESEEEITQDAAYNILSKWGWDGKRRSIIERYIIRR